MKILDNSIKKNDLLKNSEVVFDECMVKGVVDVDKGLLAIDAQLHADLEQLFYNFIKLNAAGKRVAIERVQELTEINKYRLETISSDS